MPDPRRSAILLLYTAVLAVFVYLSVSTPWSTSQVGSGPCPGPASPDLLVLVHSEPQHVERREAVRYSWGGAALGSQVSLGFLLRGAPGAEEAALYSDLLVGELSPARWATVYCPHTLFLLVVSDNAFVNVPRLLEFLQASPGLRHTLFGDEDRYLVTGDSLELLHDASDVLAAARLAGLALRELPGLLDTRAPQLACGILRSYTLSGVQPADQHTYWWAAGDPDKCNTSDIIN